MLEEFMPFLKALAQSKRQTLDSDSISYDANCYVKHAPHHFIGCYSYEIKLSVCC